MPLHPRKGFHPLTHSRDEVDWFALYMRVKTPPTSLMLGHLPYEGEAQ